MEFALEEAKKSVKHNDIPIGCIIIIDNEIITKTHNMVEKLKNSNAHAEVLSINKAMRILGEKYLTEATLYSTLEPCPMCAGAIVLAKIKRVVFGAYDLNAGACGSVFNLLHSKHLNHRVEVISGVMQNECSELISNFFKTIRANR
jgi:tRNA(adenine34) deaminase